MATLIKLDNFVLRDKYKWARDQILTEAHLAAMRRAELMLWTDVEVREIGIPVIQDKQTCYSFEIWGVGQAVIGSEAENLTALKAPLKSPAAAKEVTP
jgi:hypothetical protein